MGVRIALGAMPSQVVRLMLNAGLWPVAIGTAIGLVAAGLLARTVESFLLGVSRLDPVTYAGAALVMLGGAAAAGLVAALRVRRVSPVEALRSE